MTGGRHPLALELSELAKRLQSRSGEVGRAITDEIWREIPSYSALDADARLEVEESATRNVSAFIRALAQGKDLPKREIDALGAVGERRAHQGVPLEDVLRAFRTVGRVLWDHLSRELEPSRAHMEVAIQLAGTLMRFTDQISSAVAHHYSTAQRTIVRRQEAARREFLHDLLLGTFSSPDAMLERARTFGYDLARPHLGIVATSVKEAKDPADQELTLGRALDRIGEVLQTLSQPMLDRRGGQTVALFGLPPSGEIESPGVAELLLKELGAGWRIGVGGPYTGLEGCRRSYLEASEALEIGSIIDPEKGAYLFEDFLLYRFLRSDVHLAERFVDAVLGPIVEHDRRRRSELVKSLEMYLASDGSAKEAGRMLFAHPHTVTYRLKQIERLCGRSLKDPEDKLHLHLAVKALRLIEGSSSEGPANPSLEQAAGG